jgi:alpha/beta superfamily hydrolase
MVNQPHAYYLRYFLNKNINVMVWNYRGYGLSKGNPDPVNIRKDAETILEYMRNTIGVKGKMGVYGRSLGGVATSHLVD